MNNKIKTAFDQIHAQDELKSNVKNAIHSAALQKESQSSRNRNSHLGRIIYAPVCALLVAVVCFGFVSYNTEVGAISIDINPSIELGINMYDRVINVEGYNDDGTQLLDKINVTHMSYNDAVATILNSNKSEQYVSENSVVVVTVDSDSDDKADELLNNIKCSSSDCSDIYCTKNNSNTKEEAHMHNLSFGKYNAYLELKKYESDITVDDIREMSMYDIRSRINAYKNKSDVNQSDAENNNHKSSQATQCNPDKSCNGNSSGYNSNNNGNHNSSNNNKHNGNHN